MPVSHIYPSFMHVVYALRDDKTESSPYREQSVDDRNDRWISYLNPKFIQLCPLTYIAITFFLTHQLTDSSGISRFTDIPRLTKRTLSMMKGSCSNIHELMQTTRKQRRLSTPKKWYWSGLDEMFMRNFTKQ